MSEVKACRAGHELTEDVLYIDTQGRQRCRECRRKRDRDRYHRERKAELTARAEMMARRAGA